MRLGERVKLAANVLFNTKDAVPMRAELFSSFMPIGNMGNYLTDNYRSFINKGYMYNSDVYSIVSMINEKIASCPILLYEVKNEADYQKYKSLMKGATPESFVKAQQIRVKSLEQVKDGHPVLSLLENPNSHQDRFAFIENLVGYYNLTGNAYSFGESPAFGPNAGKFSAIYIVPSGMVTPYEGDYENPVKHYDLSLLGKTLMTVDPTKVMHIRNFNPDPNNPLKGMSPIKAARLNLNRSNSARETGVISFQNGGARGILYDNSSDQQESQWMTPEQAELLQERFDAKANGIANYNKTIVTASKVKWEKIGLSPVEMDILSSEGVDLRALCNVYHVPSELFNDKERSANNNVKEAEIAFVRRGCMPTMQRVISGLNGWLMPAYQVKGKKYVLDFDYSAFPEMHSDFQKLASWLKDCWDLTPNEKRAAKDYDRSEAPGMDDFYVPSNVIPLSRIGELDLNRQGNGQNNNPNPDDK